MPIKITDTITTYSEDDTYPTHDSNLGKGGLHSVNNSGERDAIPAERRYEGMQCYVIGIGEAYTSALYTLVGGITNEHWKLIGDFDDTPTFDGNIPCTEDYILMGNYENLTAQSPILLDIRQTLLDIKSFSSGGISIPYNYILTGDRESNPVAKPQVLVDNLPKLGGALFPLPVEGIINAAIPNPTFDYSSFADYILSGPYLPQVFAGSFSSFDPSSILAPTKEKTVISSSLAMTQIQVMQALKRIENTTFLVKSRECKWEWENLKYKIPPYNNQTITDKFKLTPSYTYTETVDEKPFVQALDEIGQEDVSSILTCKNGVLSQTTLSTDMIWIGKKANEEESTPSLPTEISMSDALKKTNAIVSDKYQYIGDITDYTEVDPLSDNYVLPDTLFIPIIGYREHIDLLDPTNITKIYGMYKAVGGSTVLTDDYVTPLALEEYTLATDAEIAAMEAEIIGIQGELTVLQAQVTTLETVTVAGLVTSVASLGAAISTANENIEDIQDELNDLSPLSTNMTYKSSDIGFDTDYQWHKAIYYDNYDDTPPTLPDEEGHGGSAGGIDVAYREGLKLISYSEHAEDKLNPLSLGLFGQSYETTTVTDPITSEVTTTTTTTRYGFIHEAEFSIDAPDRDPKSYSLKYVTHINKGWATEDTVLDYQRVGEKINFYKDVYIKNPASSDQISLVEYIDSLVSSNMIIGTDEQITISSIGGVSEVSLANNTLLKGNGVYIPVSYTDETNTNIPVVTQRIMLRYNPNII